MEKAAKKRHLPFLTAMAKAKQLYALEMKTDDFIEMAYDAWRSIGNIAYDFHRYFSKVPDDYIIQLPSNYEFVRSVTAVGQQAVVTTFDSGGAKDRHIPGAQVASNLTDVDQSLTESPGRSINYILVNNTSIRITSADLLNEEIMVVYSTISVDETGLPLLNDKEVAAIAAEVTKRDTIRKGFMGVGANNKMQGTMLQYIIAEAGRLMTAAKIDETLNDDALDKMLDIQTSWDRKVHGRRFKLY